jgi:hypothetical protein
MAMNREAKLTTNMTIRRRLNIQHQTQLTNLRQDHLVNLKSYKHREEMFHRKVDTLRKSVDRIQPYGDEDTIDEQTLTTPNCFARVKTEFQLLNFSSQTQQRLLCKAPRYNKSSQPKTNHLPSIPYRVNANESEKCLQCLSSYRTRSPTIYSCRSKPNDEKHSQTFLKQQIIHEHQNQRQHDERKVILLKDIDELKHTIDDPHSTLSALAALSRALRSLDEGMK